MRNVRIIHALLIMCLKIYIYICHQTDRTDRTNRTNRTDRTNWTDRTDRTAWTDQTDRTDQTGFLHV